jgi:hypothetical protein
MDAQMPRIQIPRRPIELDVNLAIEDGIMEVLSEHNIARVSVSSIEDQFDLFDAEGQPVPSTLQAKCEHLAKKFGTSFEFKDSDVWFRLPPGYPRKRPKSPS